MNLQKLIDLLNSDLRTELRHMMFYLHHSTLVQGLHREEISEMLSDAAESEMKHVQAFARVIIGLGGTPEHEPFPYKTKLTDPKEILEYAMHMENEVVRNYTDRINDAVTLGGVDGKYVEIFLEDQLADSRKDADNIKEMLK